MIAVRAGILDAVIARALLSALLRPVRAGRLEIVEPNARLGFGPLDAAQRATIHVRDPSFWRSLVRGSRGLGEAYAAGAWQ